MNAPPASSAAPGGAQAALHPELERVLACFREARAQPPEAFRHWPGVLERPTFFDIDALQRHLGNPLLHPDWVSLVFRGQAIPLEQAYCYKVVQTKQLHFIDKRFLEDYLRRGASVILEGLDLLEPGINAFAAAWMPASRCVLANSVAFFSQQGNELYRGHFDSDDVLVIHLSGEKRWRLFARQAPRRVNTNDLTPEQMGAQLTEVVMRPGRCAVRTERRAAHLRHAREPQPARLLRSLRPHADGGASSASWGSPVTGTRPVRRTRPRPKWHEPSVSCFARRRSQRSSCSGPTDACAPKCARFASGSTARAGISVTLVPRFSRETEWGCRHRPAGRRVRSRASALSRARLPPVRDSPGENIEEAPLSAQDRRQAAALMRVNHCGEVCAQALYQGQALASANDGVKRAFARAAREEEDHLAWTEQRIEELGGRTSLLNPLWYLGSLAIGVAAGRLGDGWNLGLPEGDRTAGRAAPARPSRAAERGGRSHSHGGRGHERGRGRPRADRRNPRRAGAALPRKARCRRRLR